ncbi:MAG TPA: SUMF1/EgtB/PvdO family nonheme iron enzyme, partial [Verrucomicrobiaceae bacterium]
ALHRASPMLSIRTDPTGAEIYSNGLMIGKSPYAFNPQEGVPAIYQIRLAGYRVQEIEHTASKKSPAIYDLKLETSKLPQSGERWTNSLGMSFLPKQNGHESARPVEIKYFNEFIKDTGRPFEGRVVRYQPRGEKEVANIVVVPAADAEAFRFWLAEEDRTKGFLTNEHHYDLESFSFGDGEGEHAGNATPETKEHSRDWQAYLLRVERQGYGSIIVRTNPPGVKVFLREELLGVSPVEVPRVRSGEVEVELRGEGFTDLIIEGDVKENEMLELFADMKKRRGVTFGREWLNSIGIKFLPVGDILLASTETRRSDYAKFVKSVSGRRPMSAPEQAGKMFQMPAIGVDREEARAYCIWLTKRERELNLIGKNDRYRLPTDEEWSRAVGLPPERGKDPAERNGRIRGIYPWGYEWPPPKGVDNFADESASRMATTSKTIRGYQDKFPGLAAVNALPPGTKGFYGLAGNVSEWVDTDYELNPAPNAVPLGTVRGGNWRSTNADELLSSARQGVPVTTRRDTIGFRIALARGTPEEKKP